MSRVTLAFWGALSLIVLGAGPALAQAGCQPTITQPCKPADKPNAPSPNAAAKRTSDQDDSNEPKDHSPRIKLDQDTDFKFGTGGIGIGRKF
jgi:hypothetical protein